MTGLPGGWARCSVADVADLLSGPAFESIHFRADGHGVRLLRGDNIEPGSLRWQNVRYWPTDRLAGNEHLLLEPGDVILAMDRPIISSGLKLALTRSEDVPSLLVQRVARVRSQREFCERFLYFALQRDDFRAHLMQGQTGTQLPHVSLKHIGDFEMAVAPRAEQERIVVALDEAFSKLDAGEASLRFGRQLLKRLRDAILAAAVTGRLVPQDPTANPATKLLADLGIAPAERNDSPDLPDGWVYARVRDIADVGSGTTPKRGRDDYWNGGTVPWVTSGAVTSGAIREPSELVTEAALRETSLRLWPVGTLLVAMYGEGQTRGRCAELAIEATCNQACAAISLRPEFDAYRCLVRLHFDANYAANRRLASGGVQPNLSGALIKDMVIALPPIDETKRLVAEVERQMSFVDECERAVDAGLRQSTALRRSVLKAAFEGRLVPQDPTDEPASVLLERIRDDRAAAQNTTSRRAGAKA